MFYELVPVLFFDDEDCWQECACAICLSQTSPRWCLHRLAWYSMVVPSSTITGSSLSFSNCGSPRYSLMFDINSSESSILPEASGHTPNTRCLSYFVRKFFMSRSLVSELLSSSNKCSWRKSESFLCNFWVGFVRHMSCTDLHISACRRQVSTCCN